MAGLSEFIVYERKPKNNLKFDGRMEKERDKLQIVVVKNWYPETPASKEKLKVYTKRSQKDKCHELKDHISSGLETSGLNPDGLIDLSEAIADLEASSSKDSGDLLESGIIGLPTEDHIEPACSIVKSYVNSGEGQDFGLGLVVNNLVDLEAHSSSEARRLDFSATAQSISLPRSGATTHDEEQSSSQSSSNTPIEGASNRKIDTTSCLSLDLENNTNSHECHLTPCDGPKHAGDKKVLSGERFEPVTPLKQNSNKRSVDGTDLNQRPLKRTKGQKRRHRPKVAGEDRKRRVKSLPEKREYVRKSHPEEKEKKEKRKYVRKPQTKEKEKKEKRKNVRRSLKAPTTEHHTESVDPKLSLSNVVNQQNDENSMKSRQHNVVVAPELAVRGYQERDDQIMVLSVSTISELAASHCRNDSMTALNPNLEITLTLQPDVGGNVGRKNLPADHKMHISSISWPASVKKSRKGKWEVVEGELLSFPKGCKSRRIKRKGKSKVSFLMSFLGLKSPPRKQRLKRFTQKGNWKSAVIIPTCNQKLIFPLQEALPCNDADVGLRGKTVQGESPCTEDLLLYHHGQSHIGEEEEANQERFTPETSISSLTCDLKLSIPLPKTSPFPDEDSNVSLWGKTVMEYLVSNHSEQLHIGEDQREADQEKLVRQLIYFLQRDYSEERMKLDFLATPLENEGRIYDRNLIGSFIAMGFPLNQMFTNMDNEIQIPSHNKNVSGNSSMFRVSPVSPVYSTRAPSITKSRGPKQGFNRRKQKNTSIDDIIRDFELLKISDFCAIVPYQGPISPKIKASRAIVPHQGSRRKLRAEVLLDKETLHQWNLLMKIDDGLGDGKEKKERDKWQEEVEIFHGRIKSFTSRMHIILGDRRFKPWKGSVVDSVVGVFLTQNVTDFLSSSAYMSLASKFPIQSISNQETSDDELDYKNSQETTIDNIVCIGRTRDLHEDAYFVTEPESKTLVGIVEKTSLIAVEDIGDSIFTQESCIQDGKILTCENPYNASRGTESSYPISSSVLFSSSSACQSSKNVDCLEDYQSEIVFEGNISTDMGLHHACNLSIPNEVALEESASNLDTGMKNQRSSLFPGETRRATNGKKNLAKKEKSYWNNLGKKFMRPRSKAATDSVDWEAVRQAPETDISDAIKSRGQHNIMARKIKKVLNRIVDYHGSIDLEWLRYAPDDDVTNYLLEIEGLGLKSVECLRLLELYHNAFPVDTNVARIAVRLGWVPLEPLPGNLQLHLLEEYPIMDSIQKYLWPRLCKLDQKALYELHYQMITFGKVFCTKLNPNCGACPMRAECRHLASAIASENLCLPGPSKKGEERTQFPSIALENSAVIGDNPLIVNPTAVSVSESFKTSESEFRYRHCQPIIEEPESPQHIDDIEDFGIDYGIDEHVINDDEEIPIIKLSNEPFRENVQYFMDKYQNDLQIGSLSRALVPLSVNVDSVPVHKLKNISRLRTEHQVYELPNGHELLSGQQKSDRNDQSPYLLAIWSPGETPGSCQPPKKTCNSQGPELCEDQTCFSCQSIWEERFNTVRGTILVPCRTAMRGRFPLNGTYFQVNEVFADHESSYNPIVVCRSSIWNLRRRTVYCGTSPNAIFKACSMKEIQENFWKGFICVRGWDAKTGAPKPLAKRFHCPPSKMEKTRKRVTKSSKEEAKDTTIMSHGAP